MSSTITTAAREYATRPPDERFTTLQALLSNAAADRAASAERAYSLRDLAITAYQDGIALQSPKGIATLTHWAHGQLCRTVGAPAGYIRTLDPKLAAECLNYGIAQTPDGTAVNVLVRAANGHPEPTIRSITSDSYGRVWDQELVSGIARHFDDGAAGGWQSPTAWSGETFAGARGDRDSFILRVNGGSIVTDPSAQGQQGQMYRGILIRNSEVGAAAVSIETILFRYICGNFMLWGAIYDRQFRRRHVGKAAARDTLRELSSLAWRWTERSASTDEQIIRGLIDREIATTKEAVLSELRSFGASKLQAETAYATCEQTESVSPRSFWGIAQGLTRASQETGYQDERHELDKLAALVLARGARLVAAA